MEINPYEAPRETSLPRELTQSETTLYSFNQIAIGGLIAGPLGGCYFLAQNYAASRHIRAARLAFGIGLALGTVTFFVGNTSNRFTVFALLPLPCLLVFLASSKRLQLRLIVEHYYQHGRFATWWEVLLISLSLLFLQLGAVAGFDALFG